MPSGGVIGNRLVYGSEWLCEMGSPTFQILDDLRALEGKRLLDTLIPGNEEHPFPEIGVAFADSVLHCEQSVTHVPTN